MPAHPLFLRSILSGYSGHVFRHASNSLLITPGPLEGPRLRASEDVLVDGQASAAPRLKARH